VFPGRFENRRSSIEEVFERFSALLAQSGLPLAISWAGEVRLTPEVLDLLAVNELPWLGTVDGLRTMLLEMPDGQIPLGTERLVAHLLQQKVRPVIVHPERNRAVMEGPSGCNP
jgi:protein-tyrosine phosphatase